ncbi:MAG: dipeptidase PepV [Eubacteriales bacterium]|nr:dipeptidase PepV [Eubacteriales bacterium]MDD3882954.1 dipeptidase PepV [Eubacteriales bacterium]MDD4513499.1 dipeptidase PepV [Eubacteriales bacterium]
MTIEEYIESKREEMVETLARWVRIPSVKGEPSQNAPFGKEVRRCLDTAIADLTRLGFSADDVDGYALRADMGEGSDEDALAILGHLDVVPAGDNWDNEPYSATIKDGKIFGRGTSDDKGPVIASMYAMAAVKAAGIPLKRKVSLILGCDEECGMDDIEYYVKHRTLPREGFSPDAAFPVINTEKGIIHALLTGKQDNSGLVISEMNVGSRPNVIPGEASAVINVPDRIKAVAVINDYALENRISEKLEDVSEGKLRITVFGKLGHAAMPEDADNALVKLLGLLRALGAKGAVKTLADAFCPGYDGSGLNIRCEDQISGKLTENIGVLNIDESGNVTATLDIRFPISMSEDALIKTFGSVLNKGGVDYEITHLKHAHHVPAESELVRALVDSYSEVTGKRGYAYAIGGGTYAACLECGVAFGATHEGEPDMAHQANEYIKLEELVQNALIYAKAIAALAGK